MVIFIALSFQQNNYYANASLLSVFVTYLKVSCNNTSVRPSA